MIDIKRATELIRQHFAELTPEQFIENLKQSCPEVFEDDLEEEVIVSIPDRTEKLQEQPSLTTY
jgi:hypothetical protein